MSSRCAAHYPRAVRWSATRRSTMGRKWGVLAATAILGLVLTACSSSTKSGGGGGTRRRGGNAVKGGTLNMLGTGDVDYMDPNISYYTTGYLGLRMWSRQLL